MCANGFHFCKEQQDVLEYYDPVKRFRLLEVEAVGKVIEDLIGRKYVTNKIRIIRVVPKKEWTFLHEGKIYYKSIYKNVFLFKKYRTDPYYGKWIHCLVDPRVKPRGKSWKDRIPKRERAKS